MKSSLGLKILLIFVLTFALQLLMFFPILFETSALLSRDAYYWTQNVIYLKEYGNIFEEVTGALYPFGFTLFCGGCTLVSPDFVITYYFMKFGGLPYLSLYLVILYLILQRMIKKKSIILISLVLCLSNVYFLYRTAMFISSSLAVLIILIGMLIFLSTENHGLIGIIISGCFLVNPAYMLFFILLLAVYYAIRFIREPKSIKSILMEIGLIAVTSFIPLVIYLLSISICFNTNLISVIASYWNTIDIPLNIEQVLLPDLSIFYEELSLNMIQLASDLLYYGVIHIIPLFILFRKKVLADLKNKDFILFLKVALTVTTVILIFTPILELGFFFDTFSIRVLEGFNPIIIIALALVFSRTYSKLLQLGRKVKYENPKMKKLLKKMEQNRVWEKISLTVLLAFAFFTYTYALNNFIYIYLYDDSMIDCVFYVNQNYDTSERIGILDASMPTIGELLFDYDLVVFNHTSNWTFEDYLNFTQSSNLKAVIIRLAFFNQSFIDEFYNNASFIQVAGGNDSNGYQLFEIV